MKKIDCVTVEILVFVRLVPKDKIEDNVKLN